MTEVEAAKLIKVLQEAYPRSEFSEGRIEIYTMMLADLPYQAAQKAVLKLIATSPFLPTIAEIRKTAAEYMYEPPAGCRRRLRGGPGSSRSTATIRTTVC